MFSLLFTFCLHFYLINIHVFDYPGSRLSGLFAEVPKSPDNRGSTVFRDVLTPFTMLHEMRTKILSYLIFFHITGIQGFLLTLEREHGSF